jgi:hypothetical protein
MCAACARFATAIELTSALQLDNLLSRVYREGIATGALEILDGSLEWADHLGCLLVCRSCGGRFRLRCETYHGLGGWFGPEA